MVGSIHTVLFSFFIGSVSSTGSFHFEPLSVLSKRARAEEDEPTIILSPQNPAQLILIKAQQKSIEMLLKV
jgi:hypothetical protein